MKALFLLQTIFLMLVSCSSSDNNINDQQTTQQFFCKINNVDFNPEFISGFISSDTNIIIITASNNNGKEVGVIVPLDITPGTYTVTNNVPSILILNMVYSQSANDSDFGFCNNGTLTIISHNQTTKTIKGTFSFTGTIILNNAPYAVTNGSFEIKYMSI